MKAQGGRGTSLGQPPLAQRTSWSLASPWTYCTSWQVWPLLPGKISWPSKLETSWSSSKIPLSGVTCLGSLSCPRLTELGAPSWILSPQIHRQDTRRLGQTFGLLCSGLSAILACLQCHILEVTALVGQRKPPGSTHQGPRDYQVLPKASLGLAG